jgi:glycosyltransferase involved in cell wall biosynthesis
MAEYLRSRFALDLVTFAPGVPDSIYIPLPRHSRAFPARLWRQGRRFVKGTPPLLDRFSGFEAPLADALRHRDYDVAVVEHVWCANYAPLLRERARRIVLDLHNTESALARSTAESEPWPVGVAFRRFARAWERLEPSLLRAFDAVFAASDTEAEFARSFGADAFVYPNTIAPRPTPVVAKERAIVFTGNLEYQANISAVRWFARQIWPVLRAAVPGLEWRVVGKNPGAVAKELSGVPGVLLTGAVEDAIPAIAKATVAVVPLLAGSGTRFKILEAWCAGTSVVSTPLGAEGLNAVPGEHLLIASTATDFAGAVAELFNARARREALVRNGRALLDGAYTLEAGWRALDDSGVFNPM